MAKFVEELRAGLQTSEPVSLMKSGDRGRVLGRTVFRSGRGFVVQTDPKHAMAVIDATGVSRQNSTPGRKLTSVEEQSLSTPLTPAMHSQYRGCVGKLIYASLDRSDLSFAVKELASGLAAPTELDWFLLELVAKYLVGRESALIRMEVDMTGGHAPTVLNVYSDSDWAGNTRTRKSVSGGYASWGNCCVGHWCRNQSTIAMSSCEAELYACTSGIAEGLYTCQLLNELGFDVKMVLWCDSFSALNVMQKPGVSRPLRHVHVRYLYMQDLIQQGIFVCKKVLGTDNGADLLTKFPTVEMLRNHVSKLGLSFVSAQEALGQQAVVVKIVKPAVP